MAEVIREPMIKKGLGWCRGCGRTVFWYEEDKLPGAFECCKDPEYYGLEFKGMKRILYKEGEKDEYCRKTS